MATAPTDFAVIGLGRFGGAIARELAREGRNVLGIDNEPGKIQQLQRHIMLALQADATDEQVLEQLGLQDMDAVVVSIGTNLEASILVTTALVDLEVKRIVAKATSEEHAKVLRKIGRGVDEFHIVFPERDSGIAWAKKLLRPDNLIDESELQDGKYKEINIRCTGALTGKSLRDLDLRRRFRLNVVGVGSTNEDGSGEKMNFVVDPTMVFHEGDLLRIIGATEDIDSFVRHFVK